MPRPPKPKAEYDSGPSAAKRFGEAVRHILSVPKAELDRREAAYQKARARKKKRAVAT